MEYEGVKLGVRDGKFRLIPDKGADEGHIREMQHVLFAVGAELDEITDDDPVYEMTEAEAKAAMRDMSSMAPTSH